MTASERLRELIPYFRSPVLQDNAVASQTYIRALPLIADVVEAAEQTVGIVGGPVLHTKLPGSLAALRKALEKK